MASFLPLTGDCRCSPSESPFPFEGRGLGLGRRGDFSGSPSFPGKGPGVRLLDLGSVTQINCMPRNIVRGQEVSPEQARRARELRANSTAEERILWQQLRRNNLGAHFRRSQKNAGAQAGCYGRTGYFADFYCHSHALVVEVDGPIHEHQRGYDRVRGEAFAKLGIRTIRVTNRDVRDDLAGVVNRIRAALKPNP